MATTMTDTNDSGSLRRLRERLALWRSRYGGRGRRIPEDLWTEATGLAASSGAERVAREVGLPRTRLTQRLAALEEHEGVGATRFVEVTPVQVDPRLPSCQVDPAMITVLAMGPAGERMQLELPAGHRGNAGDIVAAFVRTVQRP